MPAAATAAAASSGRTAAAIFPENASKNSLKKTPISKARSSLAPGVLVTATCKRPIGKSGCVSCPAPCALVCSSSWRCHLSPSLAPVLLQLLTQLKLALPLASSARCASADSSTALQNFCSTPINTSAWQCTRSLSMSGFSHPGLGCRNLPAAWAQPPVCKHDVKV